jgi:hypothetical protein
MTREETRREWRQAEPRRRREELERQESRKKKKKWRVGGAHDGRWKVRTREGGREGIEGFNRAQTEESDERHDRQRGTRR